MLSREEKLVRFGELLDRLGPGLSLTADRHILEGLFPADMTAAAKTFAADRNCTFRYEKQAEHGVFGRAYFEDT